MRQASPSASASGSAGAQPAPSRWPSLAVWGRQPVLVGVALCAMVAVSHYPSLLAGFVLDDNIFTEAPAVHAWSGLWNIWFSPADIEREGHYWPILYTTFWLEHKVWGLDPFRCHLVNVLLYMVNVLLLWRLLRRLAVPGAWAVAAVFAVHPMHVESVAWAIGRKDLLSGLFYMAAALCWIRSMEGVGDSWPASRDPTVPREHRLSRSPWRRWPLDSIRVPRPGLAALGLFVAAMLSKSVAVTLPVAFAIWLWWKNGRVTWTDAWRIAPFFLVALAIALADLSYYTSGREFTFDYELAERTLIAAHALWFYVGKLVWPADLAVIYPLWDIDVGDPLAWGYLAAVGAVVALLWFGRHRLGRGPLAGVLFFAVTLSPVLGFVDFAYMRLSFVAERYAYLAGIGVMAVLIGAAAYGAGKLPYVLKAGASGVLVAILALFGKLTWEQAGIYRDEFTFYNHIISFNPGARSIHRNLAKALHDGGRPAEALAASRIEVERFPGSANAHNTHGTALLALDRLDEAAESFQRALELAPGHKNARWNMAETRRHQRRFVESLRWYRSVLDIDPEFAPAHAGMGDALFRLGRYEQAAKSLEQAISLQPGAATLSTHHFLAEALRKLWRPEDAIERYRDVLEVDPEFASAHAGIGYALSQQKRHEEALEWLARSVSLEPMSPAAAGRLVMMGQACEALGRPEEAAEHYARALQIDSRNAAALDSLALLRFRQQRYEEALGLYETLIQIDDANAQAHVNMGATLDLLDRPEEAAGSLRRAISLDPALAGSSVEEMRDALRREQQ